ncbi:MAG: hypothetical protein DMF90_16805 [Acidobacteria bacterium]|nr:MAG: hypothetical protein DMF90_16805 [Acidobacteriota bacterium]
MASGSFSVDPDTRWSIAGSFGWRLDPRWTFGMELLWSDLKYAPADLVTPFERVAFTDPARSLLTFAVTNRVDLRRQRIHPYVVFGGGITADSIAYTPLLNVSQPTPQVVSEGRVAHVSAYLSLVVGGGIAFRVSPSVSLDVDLRGIYMRGAPSQWGRIGVGATYRF